VLRELQLASDHEMHQHLGIGVHVVQATNGRVGHTCMRLAAVKK